MIQRIQSVFYFLAAACAGALFYFPFASSSKATSPFLEDQLYNVYDHIAMLILAGISILLPLVAIFLFKNRTTQVRFGIFGIIAAILLVAVSALLFINGGKDMMNTAEITDRAGLYFPLGCVLFGALANRFVKKDDKLVQSMDRLR